MTVYYVSNNGNDRHRGTSESEAWQTLARAQAARLVPADAVRFRRGSTWTTTNERRGFVISASGCAGSPITFGAYGAGPSPTFRNPGGARNHTIGVALNGDWLVLEDVLIRDCRRDGVWVGGAHNVVQDIETTQVGIGVGVHGPRNLITRNNVHDLTMVVNDNTRPNNDMGAVGIWLFDSDNEVSYNRLINCKAPSYDYGYDGGAIEWFGDVHRCYVHHNLASSCDGFLEVGGGSAYDNIVAYNVSIDNGQFAWLHLTGGFGSDVRNFRVENNTIVDTQDLARPKWVLLGFRGNPGPDTFLFRNNICHINDFWFVSDADRRGWNFTREHNLYYLPNPQSRLGFNLGKGELRVDPLFVGGADFHLQVGSPAIDAGLDLGHLLDFDGVPVPTGAAPDIGAYEYGATQKAVLRRIAVPRRGDQAVLIESDRGGVIIRRDELGNFDTPRKLKAEARRQLASLGDDIFFHMNRDGTLALATGQEPPTWPEDENG